MDPVFAAVLCIREAWVSVKPYEQSTLPQSNLIFCLLLPFIAVDVSQGAVLKNILIPLVSVTVPHLSGEACTGPN